MGRPTRRQRLVRLTQDDAAQQTRSAMASVSVAQAEFQLGGRGVQPVPARYSESSPFLVGTLRGS